MHWSAAGTQAAQAGADDFVQVKSSEGNLSFIAGAQSAQTGAPRDKLRTTQGFFVHVQVRARGNTNNVG